MIQLANVFGWWPYVPGNDWALRALCESTANSAVLDEKEAAIVSLTAGFPELTRQPRGVGQAHQPVVDLTFIAIGFIYFNKLILVGIGRMYLNKLFKKYYSLILIPLEIKHAFYYFFNHHHLLLSCAKLHIIMWIKNMNENVCRQVWNLLFHN